MKFEHIMKRHKDKYTNIKKGDDGIFTLKSRRYPENNIQPYSLDGIWLLGGCYHVARQPGKLKSKLQDMGCVITQEGNTEFCFRFRKEIIEPVGRLLYIFPKKNHLGNTSNILKTSARTNILD